MPLREQRVAEIRQHRHVDERVPVALDEGRDLFGVDYGAYRIESLPQHVEVLDAVLVRQQLPYGEFAVWAVGVEREKLFADFFYFLVALGFVESVQKLFLCHQILHPLGLF